MRPPFGHNGKIFIIIEMITHDYNYSLLLEHVDYLLEDLADLGLQLRLVALDAMAAVGEDGLLLHQRVKVRVYFAADVCQLLAELQLAISARAC